MPPSRITVPFWTLRTPGWEESEDAAALFLYRAYSRALSQGYHSEAEAIRREMTTA